MKPLANIFESIHYEHRVIKADFPKFNNQIVHEVYSTYALTRDAEWTGRLVILPLLEDGEEGIGTLVEIVHQAPAFEHETVLFTTQAHHINPQGELIITIKAMVGDRLIANIVTGQRAVNKAKLNAAWQKLKS